MGDCKLLDELNRLRKSSNESIDSEKNFDSFKRYMHVERRIENDIKELLRNVNDSAQKTLVLVCGSAGDGKSHMVSYLKNCDEERLLDGYTILNDGTESSSPSKTAIETLNDVLDDFADENIRKPGGNIILAINLGVLNNFIESDFGKRFLGLKHYVEKQHILSTKIVNNEFDSNSPFQHVSFSDYQLYTLREEGPTSEYINKLLSKIFINEDKNPFVDAFYNGCNQCPLQAKCPVRYNFKLLQNMDIKQYISNLLVMTILKKKIVLTTREMLNYFYDIVVPQDFSYSSLGNLFGTERILEYFIKGMTPNLIFDQQGVSSLMDAARENDPVLFRNEDNDNFAVKYYVSSDVSEIMKETLENTPYITIFSDCDVIKTVNEDKDIKGMVFSTVIRLNAMKNNLFHDDVYKEFVKYLYYFNDGKAKKLAGLYNSVQQAMLQWCSVDRDKHPCVLHNYKQYSLFENVNFEPDLSLVPKKNHEEEIQRFVTELSVSYFDSNKYSIVLNIDYPLFRMIKQLNEGYIHTTNDVNNHADFLSFIDRMLQKGDACREIFITSKSGDNFALTKSSFGYKFEVIK